MENKANNLSFGSDNGECFSDTLQEEIDSLFIPCKRLYSEGLGKKYILHISATRDSNPYVSAALSDYSCDILSVTENQVTKITQLKEHTDKLTNCKFNPTNNNLVYTGSSDGTVKLWDLRDVKKSTVTFTDTTLGSKGPVKSLSSFDVSPCNRLLAAGTDLTEGDAYILFWDIRNAALLGAYWESHTDDITQVMFHPEDSNKLISGSTDGLINIYSLSEATEEDALQESLNTDLLVDTLQWFNQDGQWKICCTTSTNDLQLWEIDSVEPYKILNRENVAKTIKGMTENVYIAGVHSIKNSLLVLAGSVDHDRNPLRSFQIVNKNETPAFRFSNNTQLTRTSWMNEHINLLLTGGENGELDIWKPDFASFDFKSVKTK